MNALSDDDLEALETFEQQQPTDCLDPDLIRQAGRELRSVRVEVEQLTRANANQHSVIVAFVEECSRQRWADEVVAAVRSRSAAEGWGGASLTRARTDSQQSAPSAAVLVGLPADKNEATKA